MAIDYASRGFERERKDSKSDAGHRENSGWDAKDDSADDAHDN